jgi:hypothetical protein
MSNGDDEEVAPVVIDTILLVPTHPDQALTISGPAFTTSRSQLDVIGHGTKCTVLGPTRPTEEAGMAELNARAGTTRAGETLAHITRGVRAVMDTFKPALVLRSAGSSQRRLQPCQVGCPEDDAVAGRDVHQVEVDPGSGDPAGEIGQHAGLIVDLDDHHLALAAHGKVRDRKRMPDRLGVRHEDVELGPIAWADARRGRDVHPGVADGPSDVGQRAGPVFDVDNEVDWHVTISLSWGQQTPTLADEASKHYPCVKSAWVENLGEHPEPVPRDPEELEARAEGHRLRSHP